MVCPPRATGIVFLRMAETLYRKYRPQTFADVREQEHIKRTLQNEILRQTVAHAYVFSGPRGVGKTSMARIFAKALNCLARKEGSAEPCNVCPNCTEITDGRALDVMEIDAASHTGVDNVRERIVDTAHFPPVRGKYKIFIIDEAHMLSTPAFNALLKTLEEPPAYAVFILASTELHKFPETILSRCQRFEFRRIQADALAAKLKGIAESESVLVDAEVIEAVVRRSEGGLRDAESLFGQILALGEKHVTLENAAMLLPSTPVRHVLDVIGMLGKRDTAGLLHAIAELVDRGADLVEFCSDLIVALRGFLLLKAAGDRTNLESLYEKTAVEEFSALAKEWTDGEIVRVLEKMVAVQYATKSADIPQLPLEMAFVELTRRAEELPVAAERKAPAPTPKEGAAQSVKPTASVSAPIQTPAPAPTPIVAEPAPAPEPDKSVRLPEESKRVAPPPPAPGAEEKGSARQAITIALSDLRAKWPEVIIKVSETSQSLPFILKLADVVGVEADTIQVAFQYAFHADTFNKEQNRRIVEDAWRVVCNVSCRCLGIADAARREIMPDAPSSRAGEAPAPAPRPAPIAPVDPQTKTILEEFGGKIVS